MTQDVRGEMSGRWKLLPGHCNRRYLMFTRQRWVGTVPNCGTVKCTAKIFFRGISWFAEIIHAPGLLHCRWCSNGSGDLGSWLQYGWIKEKWEYIHG